MNVLRQILLLTLAAGLCALVQAWFVAPPDFDGSEDPWAMTPARAAGLGAVLWVDTRAEGAYRQGHVEGAIHVDPDNRDAGLTELLTHWEPDSVIVVYCDGNGCESSRAVAADLRAELGSATVYWLAGGWPALQEAGLDR